MGEIADMIVDNIADGLYDEQEEDDYSDGYDKSCKYCGKGGLCWVFIDGHGWRLQARDGTTHWCREHRAGVSK